MLLASYRIWTMVIVSILYDDDYYFTAIAKK